MRFVSVEDMALKIWECESGVLKTVKKLNLKQKIIDAVTSDMIGLLKHEYEVALIQFLFNEALDMNQDQFLLTIDASGVGCVWDLDDGLCIHEFRFSNRARLAQVVFKQFPGSNVFAAGEADAEGSSYRVSIWDLERGVMTMRAKSEEFTDYELRAICNLPHV